MNDNKTPLQGFDPRGFGKRPQSARKALGITRERLAERLCAGRNHVPRMERGIRVCSVDLAVEISALPGVATDYLLVYTATGGTAKQKLLIAIEELSKIVQNLYMSPTGPWKPSINSFAGKGNNCRA